VPVKIREQLLEPVSSQAAFALISETNGQDVVDELPAGGAVAFRADQFPVPVGPELLQDLSETPGSILVVVLSG